MHIWIYEDKTELTLVPKYVLAVSKRGMTLDFDRTLFLTLVTRDVIASRPDTVAVLTVIILATLLDVFDAITDADRFIRGCRLTMWRDNGIVLMNNNGRCGETASVRSLTVVSRHFLMLRMATT